MSKKLGEGRPIFLTRPGPVRHKMDQNRFISMSCILQVTVPLSSGCHQLNLPGQASCHGPRRRLLGCRPAVRDRERRAGSAWRGSGIIGTAVKRWHKVGQLRAAGTAGLDGGGTRGGARGGARGRQAGSKSGAEPAQRLQCSSHRPVTPFRH